MANVRSEHFPLADMTLIRIFTGWFILRYSLELFHIDDLLGFLEKENFPFPVFSGYAAKIIELVGGACLIVGLFTRWLTPLLIVVMYGVIYLTAHGSISRRAWCFFSTPSATSLQMPDQETLFILQKYYAGSQRTGCLFTWLPPINSSRIQADFTW